LKVLLLDNYDSFTYNLVHYMEGMDVEVTVKFNDEIDLDSVVNYDKIVLSPGPGLPEDSGLLMEVINRYYLEKPILGVCLGFQALLIHFGGELFNQKEVKHGLAETAFFNQNSRLFSGTESQFKIGLYHSWAASKKKFPPSLQITGTSENDVIMAFEHEKLPIAGVQFHPESILSEHGHQIIENFLFSF